MKALSSNDVAIAMAIASNTLVVSEHIGRMGPYWAISDDSGLIEVCLSKAEADERIAAITSR